VENDEPESYTVTVPVNMDIHEPESYTERVPVDIEIYEPESDTERVPVDIEIYEPESDTVRVPVVIQCTEISTPVRSDIEMSSELVPDHCSIRVVVTESDSPEAVADKLARIFNGEEWRRLFNRIKEHHRTKMSHRA
jgi:hypothetical protein